MGLEQSGYQTVAKYVPINYNPKYTPPGADESESYCSDKEWRIDDSGEWWVRDG